MVTVVGSPLEAVAGIQDGATVMVGGFGAAGQPVELIDALIESGATDLTVVNNNAGNGDVGLAALIREGRVRRIICSFPRQQDSWHFDAAYRAGTIELELVPQGNLAERIRAGGCRDRCVLHPDRVRHAAGRGQGGPRDRRQAVRARARAHRRRGAGEGARGRRLGNLVYRKTARNFGPVMATAARTTVVQVSQVVPVGSLDPEQVVTPCIYVDRVVRVPVDVPAGSAR